MTKPPCPSDRAILTVMQFYKMTEVDVRKHYMDEVHATQRLLNAGIDISNQKKLDKGKDE